MAIATRGIGYRERRRIMECLLGKMAISTKEILRIILNMVMVS